MKFDEASLTSKAAYAALALVVEAAGGVVAVRYSQVTDETTTLRLEREDTDGGYILRTTRKPVRP